MEKKPRMATIQIQHRLIHGAEAGVVSATWPCVHARRSCAAPPPKAMSAQGNINTAMATR